MRQLLIIGGKRHLANTGHEMDKYLIINADDFGLNSSVNQAILRGFLQGCLTSTSLIAVVPDEPFFEAIEILKNNPGLDFGVHLALTSDVLTQYRPLSKNMPVDESGHFFKSTFRYLKILAQKQTKSIVETELRLQIEKVLATGLKPSHLNSHYYATELPYFSDITASLAEEYQIKALRNPYETKSFIFSQPFNLSKILIVQAIRVLAIINYRKIGQHNLLTANNYYGVYSAGRMDTTRLLQVINSIKPGLSEILVHPALDDSTHFYESREFESLISSQVSELIKKKGITLTNYRDSAERA